MIDVRHFLNMIKVRTKYFPGKKHYMNKMEKRLLFLLTPIDKQLVHPGVQWFYQNKEKTIGYRSYDQRVRLDLRKESDKNN